MTPSLIAAMFFFGGLVIGHYKATDKYSNVVSLAEDVATSNYVHKCPLHIATRIIDLKKALNELNK